MKEGQFKKTDAISMPIVSEQRPSFPYGTPLLLLVGLGLISFILAVTIGSVNLSFKELLAALLNQEPAIHHALIFQLRLPRALNAFAAGGLLALSGVLMQVLLRNPLADPYILGLSGGSAVFTLTLLLFGFSGVWLTGGAFFGALLSIGLVFGIAQRGIGWTPTRLLLTGVVIAAGWNALISFILAISPQANLKSMLFWLMGDIGYQRNGWLALGLLGLGVLICLPLARGLNILMRGELQARTLGINTAALYRTLYLLASLLTGCAVVLAGSIGFVGLVVPHMLRLLAGSDHRWLIPASVLAGGSLVVLADTLARTLFAPQQLPVGVITAFIGVPLFLFLLRRGNRIP